VPTGRGTCGSSACFPGAPPLLQRRGPDGRDVFSRIAGACLLSERRTRPARAAPLRAGHRRAGWSPGERAPALSAVQQAICQASDANCWCGASAPAAGAAGATSRPGRRRETRAARRRAPSG
jgi:hypothetical protein